MIALDPFDINQHPLTEVEIDQIAQEAYQAQTRWLHKQAKLRFTLALLLVGLVAVFSSMTGSPAVSLVCSMVAAFWLNLRCVRTASDALKAHEQMGVPQWCSHNELREAGVVSLRELAALKHLFPEPVRLYLNSVGKQARNLRDGEVRWLLNACREAAFKSDHQDRADEILALTDLVTGRN